MKLLRPYLRLVGLTLTTLLCFFVFTHQAYAYAPDVTGRVITSNTGAAVAGVWVKWTDGVGGYRYAQTDSSGVYYFTSITTLWLNNTVNQYFTMPVDSNLDGTNDDVIIKELDPVNAPTWDFTCGSNPHSFSVVQPAGMNGTFTSIDNVSIANSTTTLVLPDIVYVPGNAGNVCTQTNPTFMLAIDVSSSMQDADPATGLQKLDQAKTAATNFVNLVSAQFANVQIGVSKFAGSYKYPNEPSSVSVLIAPTNNFTAVKNAITSLTAVAPASADDGTCIECGVIMANSALTTSPKPTVIFLTDGIANDTTTSNGSSTVPAAQADSAALAAVATGVANQNITYDVIGVGTSSAQIDPVFLTQMAATGGGTYYNDPSNGDMLTIFDEIATKACVPPNNPTIDPNSQLYYIKGDIFIDDNRDGVYATGKGESRYKAGVTTAIVTNLATGTITPLSSPVGNYGEDSSGTGIPQFPAGKYHVSFTPPVGYVLTTPGSFDVTLGPGCATGGGVQAYCSGAGSIQEVNFGFNLAFTYTVNGKVYLDRNQNGIQDAGEPDYTGTPDVVASQGTVITSPGGLYKITNVPPGTITVSLRTLPPDYYLITPHNGPPPTWQVTVGPSCNTGGAPGATCN